MSDEQKQEISQLEEYINQLKLVRDNSVRGTEEWWELNDQIEREAMKLRTMKWPAKEMGFSFFDDKKMGQSYSGWSQEWSVEGRNQKLVTNVGIVMHDHMKRAMGFDSETEIQVNESIRHRSEYVIAYMEWGKDNIPTSKVARLPVSKFGSRESNTLYYVAYFKEKNILILWAETV
jgi:hypothetical protein